MPNPSAQHVAVWLQKVTPQYLQYEGWQEADRRFHGIIESARAYARQHFASRPEEQEAFFDGLALALTALGHFADIEQLTALHDLPSATDAPSSPDKKKTPRAEVA